jgi:S-formylglutathione hydrolase FrmB
MQGQQAAEARTLCAAATARGITCALHAQPDRHTWQFAGRAFTAALAWLTQRLTTTPTPTTP